MFSYTGDGGQLGCSFLGKDEGVGVGRATAEKEVLGLIYTNDTKKCGFYRTESILFLC
jgi:hypothetical protein